jgi:ABC-type nitrate/sulfonate/bicarbonate transport system ATPase subunit
MDALVPIDDVTKCYDGCRRPAVEVTTLEIAPGEAIAVMGPSGTGKPTLPNLIADLTDQRTARSSRPAAVGAPRPRSALRRRARCEPGATG